jgi:hypothetical protein
LFFVLSANARSIPVNVDFLDGWKRISELAGCREMNAARRRVLTDGSAGY